MLGWVIDTSVAPLLYGIDKGFFREQGIDLELIPGRGSDLALQQINENKVQFALPDLESYLTQRAKNLTPTTAVMSLVDFPTIGVVANQPTDKPQDMVGKSWGVGPFSSGRFLLPLVLKSNGVDPSAVTLELMDFSVLYTSLFEGKIDSAEAHSPGSLTGVLLAAERSGKRVYFTPLSSWGLKGYSKILIVRDDLLARDPELVRRVVAGMAKSVREGHSTASEEEIASVLLKTEPQIRREEIALNWKGYRERSKNPGPLDADVVRANLEYLAETENLKTDLRPEQLFTNEFIPPS